MVCNFGAAGIGIVLSGMVSAGIDGLRAVNRAGGLTMSQRPDSALFPTMPVSAIDMGKAEIVCPVEGLSEALISIAEDKSWPVATG